MPPRIREKVQEIQSYPAARILQIGAPEIKWYEAHGVYHALCPFHSDKNLGNFSYNPSKDVWKCFTCGKGGHGAISFVMAYQNWEFKKTIDYLYENRNMAVSGFSSIPAGTMLRGRRSAGFRKVEPNPSVTVVQQPFPYTENIPADELSAIYRCFSAASPLTKTDITYLTSERGLQHDSLHQFFHFPSPVDSLFWGKFKSKLAAYDRVPGEERLYHKLLGVPGFFWNLEKGCVGFVGYADSVGILNFSAEGFINGIELRLPTSSHGLRYMPFSSGSICEKYPDRFSCGTGVSSIVDVVPAHNKEGRYRGIAITEGKFKALHLSYFGYTVLNIHGVGNWNRVFPVINELKNNDYGVNNVSIAFDADSRKNPPVAAHAMQLGQALMDAGHKVEYLTWPDKFGKGFDDLCNNGATYRLRSVEGQRFIDTTLAPFLERAANYR